MPAKARKLPAFDSEEELKAFLLGRLVYNTKRRRVRDERRLKLILLVTSGQFKPSDKKGLAEAPGVARITVWRDMKAITAGDAGRCPTCGQHWPQFAD